MVLSGGRRKFALTAHILASVGWLGAVGCVLGLAIAAMVSDDGETVRAAYVAMDIAAWLVLVPLAIASLVTGIVQSLGTKWGLLHHYWVVVKLWITVVATIVLLLYTATLDRLAGVAETEGSAAELEGPTVVVHSVLALVLLVAATVLAVFKPAGLTRRGREKARSAS